jgi:hypothetical protein
VRALLVLAAAAIALVLTGCGGGIDKGKLEDAMKDDLNTKLLTKSILGVTCEERGDSYHFDCTAAAEDGTLIYLRATCNSSQGGSCSWRTTRTG